MSHLQSCPSCSSLNPTSVTVCLNCEATLSHAPERPSLTKGIIKAAGLVAMSMTLTACYGGGEMYPDCSDGDLDGYCAFEDCNDSNPNVWSGTEEECSQPYQPSEPGGAEGGVTEPAGGTDAPMGGASEGGAPL